LEISRETGKGVTEGMLKGYTSTLQRAELESILPLFKKQPYRAIKY
jgi:hypothetical protein